MLGIFALLLQASAPPAAALPSDLAVSGLVLRGGRSAAVLRSAGRESVVSAGEEAFGARVVAVDAEGVLLESQGQRIRLRLGNALGALPVSSPPPLARESAAPRTDPGTPAAPASASSPGTETRNLSRAEVERRLATEMPRLLAETTLLPMSDGSRIVGMTLTRLPENSLLSLLGLRAGDVLTTLDDTPVDSLPVLLTLWTRLQSASLFRAVVIRDGHSVTLNVNLR